MGVTPAQEEPYTWATTEGWHTLTPRVFTHDVAGLVAFLRTVFAAEGEVYVGRPTELRIGDSMLMVSDGGGIRQPLGSFLYVYVKDTDASFRRAVGAGAKALEAPLDTPYGDRRATIEDAWGNSWQIATRRS
jgi:PhnB protein